MDSPLADSIPKYFKTSTKRFLIMSLLTMGIYPMYWEYKNWQAIYNFDKKEGDLSPLLKTLLWIIYIYPLFRRMAKDLQGEDSKAYKESYVLVVIYIIFYILSLVIFGLFPHFLENPTYIHTYSIYFNIISVIFHTFIYIYFQNIIYINTSIPTHKKTNRGEYILIILSIIFIIPQIFSFAQDRIKEAVFHEAEKIYEVSGVSSNDFNSELIVKDDIYKTERELPHLSWLKLSINAQEIFTKEINLQNYIDNISNKEDILTRGTLQAEYLDSIYNGDVLSIIGPINKSYINVHGSPLWDPDGNPILDKKGRYIVSGFSTFFYGEKGKVATTYRYAYKNLASVKTEIIAYGTPIEYYDNGSPRSASTIELELDITSERVRNAESSVKKIFLEKISFDIEKHLIDSW